MIMLHSYTSMKYTPYLPSTLAYRYILIEHPSLRAIGTTSKIENVLLPCPASIDEFMNQSINRVLWLDVGDSS